MKTRNGFVSNSSSSSFVVAVTDIPSIMAVDDNSQSTYIYGEALSDGYDFFPLSKKHIRHLKDTYHKEDSHINYMLYDVHKMFDDESDGLISREEFMKSVPEKFKLVSVEIDYHTSEGDFDRFVKTYPRDNY